jgi:hypothetical protein
MCRARRIACRWLGWRRRRRHWARQGIGRRRTAPSPANAGGQRRAATPAVIGGACVSGIGNSVHDPGDGIFGAGGSRVGHLKDFVVIAPGSVTGSSVPPRERCLLAAKPRWGHAKRRIYPALRDLGGTVHARPDLAGPKPDTQASRRSERGALLSAASPSGRS